MIIYLCGTQCCGSPTIMRHIPPHTRKSEYALTSSGSISLAADGVCLLMLSPAPAGRSYRPLFTLTRCEHLAVLSLWHFPSGYPGLPLATILYSSCSDFPLQKRSDHLLTCYVILQDFLRNVHTLNVSIQAFINRRISNSVLGSQYMCKRHIQPLLELLYPIKCCFHLGMLHLVLAIKLPNHQLAI